jgi:hypothetical protein
VLPQQAKLGHVLTKVLLWMRDKAEIRGTGCFAKGWRALPAGRRAWLTVRLLALRFHHAFVRMVFISVISAIVTGVGAAIVYAFWGSRGASFTQATASSGVTQGLFHGFFGGITWGATLSFATMIYWLVLRGRRIRKTFSHWLGGVAFSTVAGFLGGVVLAAMVLSVDEMSSMHSAGWLLHSYASYSRYAEAFRQTGAGWIFPIYGACLGFGVGWSMFDLFHDRVLRMFVGKLEPLKTAKQLRQWTKTILLRVLVRSGPMALGMIIAGVLMFVIYHGRNLDCAPSQDHHPTRCSIPEADDNADGQIAPLEWRAVGTSVIIYGGAFSLAVGYLLSLLTIRFGVDVPEDKSFLGDL